MNSLLWTIFFLAVCFGSAAGQNKERDGTAVIRDGKVNTTAFESDCSHVATPCVTKVDGTLPGKTELRSGKPQCQHCSEKGDRYTVQIHIIPEMWLGVAIGYWDEDGKWNLTLPDPNISSFHYLCSNGHVWNGQGDAK